MDLWIGLSPSLSQGHEIDACDSNLWDFLSFPAPHLQHMLFFFHFPLLKSSMQTVSWSCDSVVFRHIPTWSYKYIPLTIRPCTVPSPFKTSLAFLVLITCKLLVEQSTQAEASSFQSSAWGTKKWPGRSSPHTRVCNITMLLFLHPVAFYQLWPLKRQTSLWVNQTLLCEGGAKCLFFPTAQPFLELRDQWCW